ncbi:MAG: hypothetical protein ACJA1C_000332 [Crocinitomicaceae bacterium]|jgi:hypothetical protein
MKNLTLLFTFFLSISIGYSQYCVPAYGNACTSGDYIESFSFNLISNTGTGCANPGTNNYTDYSATISDSVQQGQGYTISCSPGPSWGQYFAVWIDFNQDGDFDELNEFFDIGYAAAGATVATPVMIPNGVPGGATRLRVLCHFGTGAINQPDACVAQSWGECEDYTVVVGSPPPYDMSTQSIDAPSTGCGLGMETVTATFQNNGSVTADTMILCYNVNGGAWMCDTLNSLGLLSQATYSHDFTDLLDLTISGDYFINVSVSQFGDSTAINDTIFGYMVTSVPTISSLPYSENFESGTGGWVPTGALSTWEHGVANETNIFGNGGCAIGDSMVWATGLTTPYNNNEVSYLESPCVDFSTLLEDPVITFDHIFQVEGTFENHWVEVSIDGGTVWTVLGSQGSGLNWYNQTANWDGVSYTNPGDWRKASHVLTGTAGQLDTRIRFAFTADGSVQQEGIAIDNINIAAVFPIIDVQASTLEAPLSSCGLSNAEIVMGSFINIGLDTLIGFDVCYSVNGGALVCETVADTLLPSGTYNHSFVTTADFSVVGGYIVDLSISSALDIDSCNNVIAVNVQNKPIISSYPYLETFENGQGGWEADNTVNGTWEFGTPAKTVITGAASGVNAWTTGGLGTGFYNVNENSYVNGPCFDFTNLDTGSFVAMKVWWESENSWDGANLQISTDTAATWQNIGLVGAPNNWYNDNSISGAPGGSQEGWTGDINNNGSGEWVIAKHSLDTALIGLEHVEFRIAFGSDGSVTRDGFAFDNFAIGVPPTVNIGADYVGCANYEIDLGLPGTYEWFAEDTSVFNSTFISTDDIGVFTNIFSSDTTYNAIVIYTDSLGLCASDTAMLTLNPAPYDVLSDVTICPYDSAWYNVNAQPHYTYAWNNGSLVDSSLFIYTTGGPVSVTVTDTISGCASSADAMIFQTPSINLSDTLVCGDSVLMDASNLYSDYAWSTGDSTSTTMVTSSGYVTVFVTDGIGCMTSDSANVTLSPIPTVAITGEVDTICINGAFTLDAGNGFANYDWSTGGTAQAEPITGAGLGLGDHVVTVMITDANGCTATDTTNINVDGCASIEELDLSFSIFPNPSTGIFNYEVEGDLSQATMEVIDILGKVIIKDQTLKTQGTIDLSKVETGTYLLRIVQADRISTIRLVKIQ